MLTVIWMAVMHFLFVHNIDAFFDGAQFMFIVLLWRALNIGGIICDWSICLWLHAVSVIAYLKAWYQRRCCPAGAATGPSLCLTSTNITAVTSPHEIAQSWYEPDLDCSSSLGHWCFSSLLAVVVVDFWRLLTGTVVIVKTLLHLCSSADAVAVACDPCVLAVADEFHSGFSAVGSANAFSYSLLELNSIWICIFHRLCPKGIKCFLFCEW